MPIALAILAALCFSSARADVPNPESASPATAPTTHAATQATTQPDDGQVMLVTQPKPALPPSDHLLLAHGTKEIFWFVSVSGKKEKPVSVLMRRDNLSGSDAGKSDRWSFLSQLPARVRSLANQQSDLILAFDDMPWQRMTSEGNLVSGTPLPEDRRVFEVANDREETDGKSLWALAIMPRRIIPAGPGTSATEPIASTEPAVLDPHIYQYSLGDNTWRDAGPLPEDWAPRMPYSFAVFRRTPYFAYFDGNALHVLKLVEAPATQPATGAIAAAGNATAPATGAGAFGQWRELPHLPAAALQPLNDPALTTSPATTRASTTELVNNPLDFKLLGTPYRLGLWIAGPRDAGRVFFFDEGWSASPTFSLPAMTPPLDRGIAVAGDEIRLLAWSDKDQKLQQQNIGFDGHADGTWTQLSMPATVAPAWLETVRWIVVGTMLAVVIFATSTRRRGDPASLEKLAATYSLATFRLRLAAGLVDLWPALLFWVYYIINQPHQTDFNSPEVRRVLLSFAISHGVYVLYTLLTELLFGRTPGKMLFGLQVVMLDAQPLKARGAIVRNLIRLLDVLFLFTPLGIILITPLRQRLGDMVAGTVVVMPRQGEAEKDDTAEPAE